MDRRDDAGVDHSDCPDAVGFPDVERMALLRWTGRTEKAAKHGGDFTGVFDGQVFDVDVAHLFFWFVVGWWICGYSSERAWSASL